ncbi:hypothetical protein SAMN05421810_104255 [Amycolatopsis arida]|uniref:Uncharacterized protein n=2 Tax=Amycolatopsis arida TaxID=587909 RepID=A0A1I5V6P3_9PSEU|nr:hypothetical protein CLV69_106254 [Amycolatopsis arida]SFQ03175.1 hypothetical protein SAMN05421810_104255 [Amycolatopsis arida]
MDTCHFDVLHALAVKGMAPPAALAAGSRHDRAELLAELERLRAAGLASHLERRDVWRITREGRDRHAELLAHDVPPGVRDRLRRGYDRFLPVNLRVKDACTRWQLRDGVPNDHTDTGYDAGLVAELGELHAGADPVLADLAGARDRFGRYRERLTAALDRLRGGDTTAFTGVGRDSYHDVWMELHRDLLLSLRIDRAAEDAAEDSEGSVAAAPPTGTAP